MKIRMTITFLAVLLGCGPLSRADQRSRFLLFDHRTIEKSENAVLKLGTVTKHPQNPLFVEDQPWEKRFDNLYGNVLYDEEEKRYKIWYSPFTTDHSAVGVPLQERTKRYRPPRGRTMSICYATSRNGLNWNKPTRN